MMAGDRIKGTFYHNYQRTIETFDNVSLRLTKRYITERFSSSPLFRKDLIGHYGCVNAIEFSNKGGDYLVSGGDDARVLVWNLNKVVHTPTIPRCMKTKHVSNIFCATFDSENRHIISAGNDDQIVVHNFETGELVTVLAATDATYHVCVHPENDDIFITAGEHGDVDLYDLRLPGDHVKLATGPPTFHSAIFNPVDSAIFVTASSLRGVQLWDARVPLSCLKRFDKEAGVQCAMGVAFNDSGCLIAAVRRKLPPVLYHIERTTSLVEFHEEDYRNSCTMKDVCFAGEQNNYLISGSDNFNVYVWKIPMVDKNCEGIEKVEKSCMTLTGHRSIVNQVCYSKTTSTLCSAGVEKVIKMWSPFQMVGCKEDTEISEEQRRTPYSQLDYARMIIESGRPLSHDYEDQSTSEDPRMIAFFDSLVQREQDTSSSESSSDDGVDTDAPRYMDVLRRMRAIFFEQLRSEQNGLSSSSDNESSSDDSAPLSESRTDSDQHNATEPSLDAREEGVDLNRVREIISQQQNNTTNARKRIAELRRNCLKDEQESTAESSDQDHVNNASTSKAYNFVNKSDISWKVPGETNSDDNSGNFLRNDISPSETTSDASQHRLNNVDKISRTSKNKSKNNDDSSSNSDESENCKIDKKRHDNNK